MTLMLDRALKSPETLFHLVYSSNDEKVLGFPTRRAMRMPAAVLCQNCEKLFGTLHCDLFYCSLLLSRMSNYEMGFAQIGMQILEKVVRKYYLLLYIGDLGISFCFFRTWHIILPFPSLENTHFGFITGIVAFQQVLFFISATISPIQIATHVTGIFSSKSANDFFKFYFLRGSGIDTILFDSTLEPTQSV